MSVLTRFKHSTELRYVPQFFFTMTYLFALGGIILMFYSIFNPETLGQSPVYFMAMFLCFGLFVFLSSFILFVENYFRKNKSATPMAYLSLSKNSMNLSRSYWGSQFLNSFYMFMGLAILSVFYLYIRRHL